MRPMDPREASTMILEPADSLSLVSAQYETYLELAGLTEIPRFDGEVSFYEPLPAPLTLTITQG